MFKIFLITIIFFVSCGNNSQTNFEKSFDESDVYTCSLKIDEELKIKYDECVDREYLIDGDYQYSRSICSDVFRDFNDKFIECMEEK